MFLLYLFQRILCRKTLKLAIIGPRNAGKSMILNWLKYSKHVPSEPTVSHSHEVIPFNQYCLEIWDVCADDEIWLYYGSDADGIIFVVDASSNLKEADEKLHSFLKSERVEGKPLLIFSNHQDDPLARGGSEVAVMLNLDKIKGRHFFLQQSCAINGEGILGGIEWLVNDLTN